jgi:mannose-1-phosphate guanylyltransferase
MLHALIMAGGSGTRFWPESRSGTPKQLLRLMGERSMIQLTADRLGGLIPPQQMLVLTSERLVAAIRAQLPEIPPEAIVGEPCKRDTAPCIGLAAQQICRNDPHGTMVVMPSDHVIQPTAVFQESLRLAAHWVDERPDVLVTFGIQPTYPAEIFGYIERGRPLESLRTGAGKTFEVVRFREKPDALIARQYLDAGAFYWNSGIFVWKARTILDALAAFQPRLHGHLQAIEAAWGTRDYDAVLRREFAAIEGISIDYAVMEHAKQVLVVEAPFAWDDVGSWQALARLRGTDAAGNTVVAKHLGFDTRGTIVRGPDDHLIVTLGLSDCIVVHTPDATLVANKHNEEAIRRVVKLLEERGWIEYL